MAGLYFHVPYCKRVCSYCDFFRTAALETMPQTIAQMHRELHRRADFVTDRHVATVYFGGGTPSLLPPEELQRFIDDAARVLDLDAVGEITVEVNPDDVTAEYVAALRATSVNRVSVGVQSLSDDELRLMNRRHTAAEAIDAVYRLRDAGFENLTADLIFGVEGYGDDCLEHTLQGLLQMQVQHISAYHLTIEERTRFGRLVSEGKMREIADTRSEQEFLRVHDVLCAAGFEHYEVSNYARTGFRAQHNASYWSGAQYLGVGAGAHSFNGECRRWNEPSIKRYLESMAFGEERLSERDKFNEYVMTHLRTVEGVSLDEIERRWGAEERRRTVTNAQRSIECEELLLEGARMYIPAERFLTSDAVISTLFEI